MAARRDDIEFHDGARNGDTATITYETSGVRANGQFYRALCSTSYERHGGEWRMVVHRQTPLA